MKHTSSNDALDIMRLEEAERILKGTRTEPTEKTKLLESPSIPVKGGSFMNRTRLTGDRVKTLTTKDNYFQNF